jgi:spermidine synthase
MVLELVASRLIARHLGSSLYTWTSVIGVVLAGITVGNYMGGRIADHFNPRKSLSVLFGISSVACVLVILLNNLVGGWMWLWEFSWPVHIFAHVTIVFLLPSVLLGTISPVAAKMALDLGLPTGRTVGDIYACGAAGSIAGTFFAGFYLIATMGTIAIIWTIGAVLLLMGILYWAKLWVLYIWAAIFIAFMTMGMAPAEWAASSGSTLGLRAKPNPKVIYEDETQYCYVAVSRISENPDHRAFMQDKLKHSELVMADVTDLKYSYEQIHAAITHRFAAGKNRLSVLVIGGGGYVFPRYVEEVWPGSRVDVAEIDPRVTEAAIQAFGLSRDTTINTISMDARNYVDDLVRKERDGGEIVRYDFIYEDALNDYSIPFQLVTKEFNDKIAVLLGDEGIYAIELIDIFDSGLFLGSYVNTLQETFSYVGVITTSTLARFERNTFVIVAANQELDLEDLAKDYKKKQLELWHLDESDMAQLKTNSGNMIMVDDYAPVENLLAPVVLQSSVDFVAGKYLEQAEELSKQGRFDESLRQNI